MTQEEKQLRLKDLCARLPYDTIIEPKPEDFDYGRKWVIREISRDYEKATICYWKREGCGLSAGVAFYNIDEVKPFLRPMSSMTEDERKEIAKFLSYEFYVDDEGALIAEDDRHRVSIELMEIYIDWLNAHHFDYRGMIPMGLALEAHKDMYKTE